MTIKEDMTAVLTSGFSPEFFGEEIVYNGAPINGIFKLIAAPVGSAQGSKLVGRLQVLKADVATWAVDDQVTVAGETWRVKSALEGSNWYKHVLQVERDRRVRP